jgi:hypothetical protein
VRPGRVFVGPFGDALIAREDGGLDELHQGASPWARSIAADPTATRRTP